MLVLRISLSTLVLVPVAGAVLWWLGGVPNRQWNTTRETSVQLLGSRDGRVRSSMCVVELDDQGVMWDPRQLEWTLGHLEDTMAQAETGTIVLVFVHGWKQDAARGHRPDSRLSVFRRDVERVASLSRAEQGSGRAVVGVYLGWRGRSFTLPVLENLTFWNRRVAAARASSTDTLEILLRVAGLVSRHRTSKVVVMGHSLGGAIVERSLAPALVAGASTAAVSARPAPVSFDLIVLANPASSALDAKRLVDFFDRNGVRLATVDGSGETNLAQGPLIASINAEGDLVNRISFPVGMWFNGWFLRFRNDASGDAPGQRRLAMRAAGHEPSIISHDAFVREDGSLHLEPRPFTRDGAPYWIIRVPAQISSGHSDVTGELFGRLLGELMQRNQVFDPAAELVLTTDAG